MRACGICGSVPGVFHLVEHPLGLTMLLDMKRFPLSGIYSIPLNVCDTLLLPIILLVIIKVGSYAA